MRTSVTIRLELFSEKRTHSIDYSKLKIALYLRGQVSKVSNPSDLQFGNVRNRTYKRQRNITNLLEYFRFISR